MFFAKLNGAAWGPQAQIPGNVYSDGGPALAAFGGKLIAAWKSVFDQSLHYSSYNGTTWSAPAQIPGVASSVGPALAVFGSKLYAAWKGENADQGIWYASYNGYVMVRPGARSPASPAASARRSPHSATVCTRCGRAKMRIRVFTTLPSMEPNGPRRRRSRT